MGHPRLTITVGILLMLSVIAAIYVNRRSMGSPAHDDVRFFFLRGLDAGAADDPASPVANVASRLRAAGVPFTLHETR